MYLIGSIMEVKIKERKQRIGNKQQQESTLLV